MELSQDKYWFVPARLYIDFPDSYLIDVQSIFSSFCLRVHWSTEAHLLIKKIYIQCVRKQCGGAKFDQHDCKNLELIWSCGCYLHATFHTAPLGIKWLEEWEKKKKLNDSVLSSYFCTCFLSRAVYIFIREFSTLPKVFGFFQDVGEKSLQTGEGKKKIPESIFVKL